MPAFCGTWRGDASGRPRREGVTFVPAHQSPNGQPLVLVGNEVSRTITVFQVDVVR